MFEAQTNMNTSSEHADNAEEIPSPITNIYVNVYQNDQRNEHQTELEQQLEMRTIQPLQLF